QGLPRAPEAAARKSRRIPLKTLKTGTETGEDPLDGLIGPNGRRSALRELQPHRPVALWVVLPVLAHLHVEEEMHRLAMGLGDVLAGRGPDRLDGAAALADHDLAVAFAGHEHGLLDPRR